MRYITILDFETGKVYIYRYNAQDIEAEDFIINEGFSLSSCHWMVTDGLNLQIHDKEG